MTAAAPVDEGRARGASFREARRQRRLRRRRKIRLAGAAFLALFAVIAAWLYLLRRPPKPLFISFALTEYENLPSNPFALQDSELLRKRFGGAGEEAGSKFDLQDQRQVEEDLRNLSRINQNRLVVIHLCARAWADDSEVYLPAIDGTGTDPARDLRLSRVLALLKECPGRKLLLLDVMRPVADPRRGAPAKEAADLIPGLVREAADPKLAVLAACSAGQESLTSEDLRHSAFAYYLGRGLSGEADGFPDTLRDGRVSVRELAEFVRDRVDRWAVCNRAAHQQPVLFPADRDFKLLACERLKADEPPPSEPHYPDELRTAWAKLENDAEARRLLPRHLRRARDELLNYEGQWRAGRIDGVPAGPINRPIDGGDGLFTVLAEVKKSNPGIVARPGRPAAALEPPAREALGKLRDALAAPPPAADAKAKEAVKAFLGLVNDNSLATRAVFDLLLDSDQSPPLRPTVLAALDRLLPPPDSADLSLHAESAMLHRLAGLSEAAARDRERWEVVARQALKASRAWQRVADADPAGFEAARPGLDKAADAYHKAAGLLFADPPDAEGAIRGFGEAAVEYEHQVQLLADYARAREAYEQLLALLPAVAPACAERGKDYLEWTEAMRAARDAAGTFEADEAPRSDDLDALARRLERWVGSLGARFTKTYAADLAARAGGAEAGPAVAREIDDLLRTPRLRGEDRAALWEAGRGLGRRLHEQTPQRDNPDDPTFAARLHEADGAADARKQAARNRAGMAQELDRLAGPQPPPAAQVADDGPAAEKLLLAADRRDRILGAGGDDPGAARLDHDTLLLCRRHAAHFWGWLATRYDKEGGSVPAADAAARLYRSAAAECRTLAGTGARGSP